MQNSKALLYDKWMLAIAALTTLSGLLIGCLTYNYIWFALPFGFLFLYVTVADFKFIFYLLVFCLPLSIEYSFTSSLGTDLPTEPLMLGLMLVFITAWSANKKLVAKEFLTHPLFFLLALHFIWTVITVIYSSNHLVSVKILLAKSWYLVVFVLLGSVVLREVNDFKKAFWCIFIPMMLTIFYTIIRHAKTDFSFASVNHPMAPFYRNHVNYAAFIAQLVPLTWFAITWYKRKTITRNFLLVSLLFMLVALFLSYTRSSWLSVVVLIPAAFLIRKKLIGKGMIAGAAVILAFVFYMSYQNRYLYYSPDFDETIMHESLGEHLSATYNMEDISSGERVFRWIAGFRMWEANPIVGYGPGNFYNFYKPHAVSSFATFVSRNPEKSTVHNYFLLMLVEQGIIGLIIFSIFTGALLWYGQHIYHKLKDKQLRRFAMALTLTLVAIYVNTFLSDLIETDKVGTIYFMVVAMLINLDIKARKEIELTENKDESRASLEGLPQSR